MSCGVAHRRGLDLALLWLWQRPGAVALIRPLAWEPPYATGVALKKKKKIGEAAHFRINELKNELPCDYYSKLHWN